MAVRAAGETLRAYSTEPARTAVNCNPNCNPGVGSPSFSPGFILSPSATLRVAGLAPRVKVEHPTV